MGYDRKYLVWGLVYAAVGMCVGIFMAASHDHGQFVSHAHILLVGFVVSFIYGVIHKLWLGGNTPAGLARAQFVVHQAGTAVMSIGLLLLYGTVLPPAELDPVLALASITVLLGALLMLFMVLKANAVSARAAR